MRFYPPRGRSGWDGTRDRAAQARFRRVVMAMAGGRCQYAEDGVRCIVCTGLEAHHTQPGNDDPATGVLLCYAHHQLVDSYARVVVAPQRAVPSSP